MILWYLLVCCLLINLVCRAVLWQSSLARRSLSNWLPYLWTLVVASTHIKVPPILPFPPAWFQMLLIDLLTLSEMMGFPVYVKKVFGNVEIIYTLYQISHFSAVNIHFLIYIFIKTTPARPCFLTVLCCLTYDII